MKHLLPAVQCTALRIPWAAVGGCAAALLLTAAAPGGQYAPVSYTHLTLPTTREV